MASRNLRLLLLPGMDGTGELFAGLLSALPAGAEASPVRYPSRRVAPNSELVSIIHREAKRLTPCVLVAESFSTPLAIQYAAASPENVQAVVLCAGFASNPAGGWLRPMAGLLAPALFHLRLSNAAIEKFLLGADAPPLLLQQVRRAIASVSAHVLANRLRTALATDVRAQLPAVQAPILYLQASHDRLVRPRSLDEIRQIEPEIEIATVNGPHMILQREPQRCAEEIVRFVEGLA
jgi:pimeloyl-ACP methyl ester carboxylesterase